MADDGCRCFSEVFTKHFTFLLEPKKCANLYFQKNDREQFISEHTRNRLEAEFSLHLFDTS